MKRTMLILTCFMLISPTLVFGWRYYKQPQWPKPKVFATKPDVNQQSEIYVKRVVDANGLTVGYLMFNDMVGVNYNGQIILIVLNNGYLDEREVYFEDNICSGAPYIYGSSGYGFGWYNPIGFVNSNAIYITTDSSDNSALVAIRSIQYSNGTCVELDSAQTNVFQIAQRIDNFPKFTGPFKIINETQGVSNPLQWWREVEKP